MINTKETYNELKKRHQEGIDSFEHWFFAFSNDQLEEGLKRLNTDAKSIVSIGSGGYVLKSHVEELKSMLKNHREELKQGHKDRKFLLEALTYQLQDHEYCITHDVTDALEALGLEIEDIPKDILSQATKIAGEYN